MFKNSKASFRSSSSSLAVAVSFSREKSDTATPGTMVHLPPKVKKLEKLTINTFTFTGDGEWIDKSLGDVVAVASRVNSHWDPAARGTVDPVAEMVTNSLKRN